MTSIIKSGVRNVRVPLWLAVLALLAGVAVVAGTSTAQADVQPAAGQYVPLTPARIVSAASVAVLGTYTFSPLGKGGVPTSGVSAVAFELSVHSTGAGWLEVFPTGVTRPTASNINYTAAVWTTNSVVAGLGTGNQVSIYNGAATQAASLYIDIMGYYSTAGGSAGSTFVPLNPARIASAVAVAAGASIAVAPLGLGGIPTTNVSAVLAHVTVNVSVGGHAVVYPDGVTMPGTSDINFGTDGPYTNQIPVKLGADGKFRVYSNQAAAVTVDIVGYYQTPAGTAAGSTFVGLTPARVLSAVIIAANTTASYTISGAGGVPTSGVGAVAFNLTANDQGAKGALSVFAADIALPVARQLSYHVGGHWDTLQVSRLSADGRVSIHNTSGSPVRLFLDVAGYYRAPVAPGAPTAVVASADDGRANVSWTRPSSDGGANITGYRITASPGGSTVDVIDTTAAAFVGLTNGTAYTFTVSALNGAGRGPVSAPSAAVTPRAATAPGAPAGVTGVARYGSVQVHWQRPVNDGLLPLTTYTVTAAPGGATATASAPATGLEFTGLTNGTAYRFTVTATNALGTGPASAASAAVTPGATVADTPNDVIASTSGNNTIAVGWNPPTYTGGNPITGYTIVASPGGQSVTAAATTHSVSFTALTNGTAYTFAVTAQTVLGASAASTSQPVMPDFALTAAARQPSTAALTTLTAVGPDLLTFVNAPAEITGLPVGAVLVVPTATAAPDGFLRKVDSVTTTGTTTRIETTDAALTDAFTDAAFGGHGTQSADDPDTPSSAIAPQASAGTIEVPVTDWEPIPGVKVDGKISVDLDFDSSFKIKPPKLIISTHATTKAELTATVDRDEPLFDKQKLIKSKTIKEPDPETPYLLRPTYKINWYVFAKGSVSAGLSTSMSLSKSTTISMDLFTLGSLNIQGDPMAIEYKEPAATASATFELGVRMEIVSEVLGKDIAKLHFDSYPSLTVQPYDNPWWKVDACLRVGVEVLPFFGKNAYKNDNLYKSCDPIASAKGTLIQLLITPHQVHLAQNGTVQFAVRSQYSGGQITWGVEGSTNGGISPGGFYTAPAANGVFTVTATIPSGLGRPAQTGSAYVVVGAPGDPGVSVTAAPVNAEFGVNQVSMTITPYGPAADYYWVQSEPMEPDSPCYGWGWSVTAGTHTLADFSLTTIPVLMCNLLITGKTYTFTVTGFNNIGSSDTIESNPVTITSNSTLAGPATADGGAASTPTTDTG